jgi:ABC-type lipoprotein release transport system permease subunit
MFVVACVTAAMITILSAFNGIESLVSELFSTFDAELTISPAEGKVFTADDSLLVEIRSFPEVKTISKALEDDVIVRYDGQPAVATLRGVDTLFAEVTDIRQAMRYGEFQLERSTIPCAIPGLGVQSELGIPFHPEDFSVITISAPIRGKKLSRYKEKALNTLPIAISGVFSVNAEMDVKYIIAPLSYARELFNYDQEVSQLSVALHEDSDPEEVKQQMIQRFGAAYHIETRYDKNILVHQTNKSEKWATFLILAFIMLIAAFNIMASLTMLIIEKRKDIFILQSMGLTATHIRRIFSNQGILINAIGAVIGLVFGLLLCVLQDQVGLLRLEGSIVEHYPVQIRFLDVLGVLATVFTIGTLFSTTMVRYLVKRFAL